MQRKIATIIAAGSVGLFVCASLWLMPGGTASAGGPPPRTPLSATQTAVAATATAAAAAANRPAVAAIKLDAPGAPATAWTVVQWQDGLGGWHDVEGWRGDLDEGQQKVWWVLSKDFNTGPFRWVVYDKRGGRVWSTSKAFTLPGADGQWLRVNAVP
jgi:hypothetical protein